MRRVVKINREKVLRLITEVRWEQQGLDVISDSYTEWGYDFRLDDGREKFYEVIEYLYRGVSNGYLSTLYEMLTGKEFEVVGGVFDLYACPCCNYKTLDEIYGVDDGGYDICPICHWEDDGTTEINSGSSVNSGSIAEYQLKMKQNKNYYYREQWLYSDED